MAREIKNGTIIFESGQPFHSIAMIIKGCVRAVHADSEFFLDKGDIIGLCELFHESYIFTYIASGDAAIVSFPYQAQGLTALFNKQADFALLAAASSFKQIKSVLEIYEFSKYDCSSLYKYITNSYNEYASLCSRYNMSPRALPGLETIEPLDLEDDIAQWMIDYYENMSVVVLQTLPLSPVPYNVYVNGLLMKASQDIAEILSVCRILYDYKADISMLLMNENRLDLFDLYTTLYFRIGQDKEDSTSISAAIGRMMINLDSFGSIERELCETRVHEYKKQLASMEEHMFDSISNDAVHIKHTSAVADSLNTILAYAKCDEKISSDFRYFIEEYKKQMDKNATDDASRNLRTNITKLFYKIYTAAFQASLNAGDIPAVLKMFFQFGYVDEELAGIENAAYLYSIAEAFPSSPEKNVYTVYEWLKAIYEGKKEPSRNEFDADYTEYVHELKVTGKITPALESQMVNDNTQKVLFELQNMFPLVNKITFGRLSTFCPVFSEHNVLKELSQSVVTADKAVDALDKIRSIDFGAFCRETVYSNLERGITKEFISIEVLPDIILLPNIGIRGVMWQEIEGKRRTTPARLMLSVFQMEDLLSTFARLTGEFRWEMCKRVQGARWNDVSDPSLTSEYFEYIQFYKKNHDLTSEAKDKIKSAMQKAKNNYKEMFVRDYITWILYEGNGSPHLNKVARNIIFTYCPFKKEVREKLKTNPLYKDILDRYEVRTAQKIHHMDNLYHKLQNSRMPIPEEIAGQKKFLES